MPEQLDRSNEHLVAFDDDIDQAAALEAIESAGGRVLHRIDDQTLIVASRMPAAELGEALPAGARLIDPDAKEIGDPNQQVVLEAFRLRGSDSFREAKKNRPHDGTDWGEEGLEEPDAPDAEQPPGPPGRRTTSPGRPRK